MRLWRFMLKIGFFRLWFRRLSWFGCRLLSNELWGLDHSRRDRAASVELVDGTEWVVYDRHIKGRVRKIVELPGLNFGENRVASPSTAILGAVRAALAPIIGTTLGGSRKVKSVNSLVEALGSRAQQRVIAVTRTQRGRGRMTKVNFLVEMW
ncbi:hypothetical protein V6N11_021672 [Hibiscus sabdariffa]|uniref:Secreted protein n=1 Tax=Hibiscus sabdariffa TaxID=183260 RepID=A0ABR1Z7J0_9ROSI